MFFCKSYYLNPFKNDFVVISGACVFYVLVWKHMYHKLISIASMIIRTTKKQLFRAAYFDTLYSWKL